MDLRLNMPPQHPVVQESIARALGELREQPDFPDLLDYGSTAGRREDREAAAFWLRARLTSVQPDDVVICAGGASLLVALLTTFSRPGDAVVTDTLTYPGIRAVCRHFERRLVGVPSDGEGILPDELARACERTAARLLYCTPTIHNPTTATMSPSRRAEIAAVAEAFDLVILEDDAYGLLPLDSPHPLATFAPQRTFYMASLSKCISPALRLAYCVGPESHRADMTEGVRVVTFLASKIMTALATSLIQDCSAHAILETIRSETAARHAIAREILDGWQFAGDEAGPHVWLSLPPGWDIPALGAYLRENGVAAKGDGFAVDGAHPDALRLALGTPATRDDLERGLLLLATTLRERTPASIACEA